MEASCLEIEGSSTSLKTGALHDRPGNKPVAPAHDRRNDGPPFRCKNEFRLIRTRKELCRFPWSLARYGEPGRCPPLPFASGIDRNGRGNRQWHWLGAAGLGIGRAH